MPRNRIRARRLVERVSRSGAKVAVGGARPRPQRRGTTRFHRALAGRGLWACASAHRGPVVHAGPCRWPHGRAYCCAARGAGSVGSSGVMFAACPVRTSHRRPVAATRIARLLVPFVARSYRCMRQRQRVDAGRAGGAACALRLSSLGAGTVHGRFSQLAVTLSDHEAGFGPARY